MLPATPAAAAAATTPDAPPVNGFGAAAPPDPVAVPFDAPPAVREGDGGAARLPVVAVVAVAVVARDEVAARVLVPLLVPLFAVEAGTGRDAVLLPVLVPAGLELGLGLREMGTPTRSQVSFSAFIAAVIAVGKCLSINDFGLAKTKDSKGHWKFERGKKGGAE